VAVPTTMGSARHRTDRLSSVPSSTALHRTDRADEIAGRLETRALEQGWEAPSIFAGPGVATADLADVTRSTGNTRFQVLLPTAERQPG